MNENLPPATLQSLMAQLQSAPANSPIIGSAFSGLGTPDPGPQPPPSPSPSFEPL